MNMHMNMVIILKPGIDLGGTWAGGVHSVASIMRHSILFVCFLVTAISVRISSFSFFLVMFCNVS